MDSNEKGARQNSGQKKKKSAGQRNPNLRLIKNGDAPVKEEKKESEESGQAPQKEKKKPGETRKTVRKGTKKRKTGKTAGREKKETEKTEKIKKPAGEGKKEPEEMGKPSAENGKKPKGETKSAGREKKKTGRKEKAGGKKKKTGKADLKGKKPEAGEKAGPKGKKPEAGEKADPKGKKPEAGEKVDPKGKKPKTGEKEKPEAEKTESGGKEKAGGEKKESGGKEKPEEEKKKTGKTKKKPERKTGKKSRKPSAGSRERNVYQDRPGLGEWFVQHKSLVIIGLTVTACFALLAGVYYYISTAYEVTTVYVDGNVHYTNEEVMDMVMEGRYGNNSLYLAIKYKDKGIEGVPFVEKMDVNILTPNTIRISVYEKALAGYVEYLGRYMYFDRDGTVVESSAERTRGIPQVTGLHFDYVVVNEPLPVENDEIFKRILDITQLLNKYELTADKIFFDSSYDLTLFFGNVRVTLGSSSEIDQKIIRLKNILPELEGKSGTLQMENYTEDTRNITFHQE